MYNMVMDYFKDLNFLHWDTLPEYTLWAERTFMDYYSLQYLKSGNMTLIIDDNKELILTGPTVWFTYPGPRFRFGSRNGESWNHNFITFSGPRAETYVQSGLFPGRADFPAVKLLDNNEFEQDFMQLLSILDGGNTSDSRAVHLLEGLLLQLHFLPHRAESENPLKEEFNRIAWYLSELPEKNWSFTAEAEKLMISYDYFRHQFKATIGMSPGRFLMYRRLLKAGLLLRTTDLPIKQIASNVGLDDLYYFSRQFKKYFHLPPGRYRKEFQTGPF